MTFTKNLNDVYDGISHMEDIFNEKMARIKELETENEDLLNQIEGLTNDTIDLENEVKELKEKYEFN